ncbi:hypothetical protein MettiDRAFT_1925 [Methanolobus tindarius DSM 2278]|uniref:Uncharacterized protein n=1 Tax=Methanolobus tindarius DSM 2278 TaxID=1090322 RepID=W9DPW9_METTI|nr:hypothetical protein [Methanolobus tindarius]ETA68454.1 hypothetical protein MettiDRAFT_1925 [Methanolobus tindarius DSM 2278]
MKGTNSKNMETNLNVKNDVKSWMRTLIQGISLLIFAFLLLILTSIDNMVGFSTFSKQLTTFVTLIYLIIFLLLIIDPNQVRIFTLGHFEPYKKLLILIAMLLLTYVFLVPAILYMVGMV